MKPFPVCLPTSANTFDGELMPSSFFAPSMAPPTTSFAAPTRAPTIDLIPEIMHRIRSRPTDTSRPPRLPRALRIRRSEEHTSELQSLMRNSYAVFCLIKLQPKHKTH